VLNVKLQCALSSRDAKGIVHSRAASIMRMQIGMKRVAAAQQLEQD
jgi:hypothetical protein